MALTRHGRLAATKWLAEEKMKFVGLFEAKEVSLSGETSPGGLKIKVANAKSEGFTNGKMLWFSVLSGTATNVFAKRPYEVLGEETGEFEIAELGGAAITIAGTITPGSTRILLLTHEASRVSAAEATKRVPTGFASSGSEGTDAWQNRTSVELKVESGRTVSFATFWNNETIGSGECFDVEALPEPQSYLAGEGAYTLTSDTLEAPMSLA